MLQITHDLSTTGTVESACSDSNFVYAVTTLDYRVYTWSGALLNNAATALAASPSCIVLAGASAVIVYPSARASIVDSLGNKTDITTNALATYSNYGQMAAGATPLNLAMAISSTSGKITKIDPIAQTITQLSPSGISGIQATCILYKPDTQTWILGTINGKVLEINTAGATIGTILTLPNTPNLTAPTIQVTGLSYYNSNLAIATNTGNLYFYSWATQTLNYILPSGSNAIGGSGSMNCTSLTDSASGLCLYLSGGNQPGNSTVGVTEMFMNSVSGGPPTMNTYYNESIGGPICGGIQPIVTGINLSKAFVVFPNSTAGGIQIRLYNISNPGICSEPTRFQVSNNDVASRCIRIRDEGIGKTTVEVDQAVSAGSQPLNCTSDRNYIELNLVSGSPNQWDIREFST